MYSREVLSGLVKEDIDRIVGIEHSDPHSVLGAHPARIQRKDGIIIRVFHPDAISAELLMEDERVPMRESGAGGL